MNKLEIGMWIRTNNGNIRKITELVNSECIDEPDYYVDKVLIDIVQDNKTENTIYMEKWLFDENIIKASYNIIDLIEVGDYVNGVKVTSAESVFDGDTDRYLGFGNHDYYIHNSEDIKSIVTKEQFESIKYEVE